MIDLSTDEGIREGFREIADWPATAPADSNVTMIRTDRSHRFGATRRADRARRFVAAAAVLLVVAGAVGLVVARWRSRSGRPLTAWLVGHGRQPPLREVRASGGVGR